MELEEITINFEDEGGNLIIKELDKEYLTKGAWTTVMFRFQELSHTTGEYGKEKFSIRRYQKVSSSYRQKSKFNISSADQAKKLIEVLEKWTKNDSKGQ